MEARSRVETTETQRRTKYQVELPEEAAEALTG
jgi:hypothetical protein